MVYVAAECGLGIKERLDAFRDRYLTEEGALHLEEVPFAVVPSSVDLCDPNGHTEELIRLIREHFSDTEIVLVVIDTLSRAMAGHNENASEDMTDFIRNCDRIRQTLNCHLLVVHHSGKDVAAGSRGHSSLRAATDTEIEVAKDKKTGISTATVTKQRDRSCGDEFHFRIEQVEIGLDENGAPITSCVVVEPDLGEVSTEQGGQGRQNKPVRLTDDARIALDQLIKAKNEVEEEPPPSLNLPADVKAIRVSIWRAYCNRVLAADSDKSDSKSKAFRRARTRLQAAKRIDVFDEWVWPL